MVTSALNSLGWRTKSAWALVTVLACAAAGAWWRPLTADNQVYFFVAERAASGVPPHLSLVDSKSQWSGLLGAAGIVAGRAVGLDDVRSTRVVSIAFAAAAVAAIAELGLLVGGARAGGHLAALALLGSRGFVAHAAIGSNPKIFLVTFVVLAHLLCARRRWWAAGAAACAAFLCWQPGLVVVVAVGAEALLVAGGGAFAALAAGGGALAVFVAYQLYYATYGALVEQLRQCYVMPLGSVHGVGSTRSIGRALWFVVSQAERRNGSPWLPALAWFAWLCLIAARVLVNPSALLRSLRARPAAVSLVLGSLLATMFTLYDHQGLPDLLLPAPYFALAAAWLAVSATDRAAAVSGFARLRAPALALVAVVLLAQAGRGVVGDGREPRTLDEQYEVGAALRHYIQEYDGVWCYRCLHLLGFAHADNWVPYGLLYDDVGSRFPIRAFRPLRDGRMPEVILRTRGEKGRIPGARGYLRGQYRQVEAPLFAREGVQVYVRRRAAGAGGGRAGRHENQHRVPAPRPGGPQVIQPG